MENKLDGHGTSFITKFVGRMKELVAVACRIFWLLL